MLLFYSENEVADEVSRVVGANHRPLLSTDTGFVSGLLHHNLSFLVVLKALSNRVHASNKPIGRLLHIVIPSVHPIAVYDGRRYKVQLKE